MNSSIKRIKNHFEIDLYILNFFYSETSVSLNWFSFFLYCTLPLLHIYYTITLLYEVKEMDFTYINLLHIIYFHIQNYNYNHFLINKNFLHTHEYLYTNINKKLLFTIKSLTQKYLHVVFAYISCQCKQEWFRFLTFNFYFKI